ncbi:MAG: hypothetical protein Q9185_004635 [Variospora sp. 1 TL-2023]
MRDIREQEITELTNRLKTEIQALEGINGKVRDGTVQLEKLLQEFIAQLYSEDSMSSSLSEFTWEQLRQELQAIGINSRHCEQNLDMTVKTLQEVLDRESALSSVQTVNNGSWQTRIMSYVTGRSNGLISTSASGHMDDVRMLLRKGVYVNAQDGVGETALGLATRNGHIGIVELLLNYQADFDNYSKGFTVPLHLATASGKFDVVRLMLQRGAKILGTDQGSSLHLAA